MRIPSSTLLLLPTLIACADAPDATKIGETPTFEQAQVLQYACDAAVDTYQSGLVQGYETENHLNLYNTALDSRDLSGHYNSDGNWETTGEPLNYAHAQYAVQRLIEYCDSRDYEEGGNVRIITESGQLEDCHPSDTLCFNNSVTPDGQDPETFEDRIYGSTMSEEVTYFTSSYVDGFMEAIAMNALAQNRVPDVIEGIDDCNGTGNTIECKRTELDLAWGNDHLGYRAPQVALQGLFTTLNIGDYQRPLEEGETATVGEDGEPLTYRTHIEDVEDCNNGDQYACEFAHSNIRTMVTNQFAIANYHLDGRDQMFDELVSDLYADCNEWIPQTWTGLPYYYDGYTDGLSKPEECN